MNSNKWDDKYIFFLDKIKKAERIVITRHINPDGDCMGAQYSLYHFIKQNFKGKKVFCEGGTAKNYLKDLFPLEKVLTQEHKEEDFDLQIIVDTSSKDRVDGKILDKSKVFVIDHHKHQDKLGDNEIRDSKQGSVCQVIAQMLFYFVDKHNMSMNNQAAKCLYIGIVTDTNRFWYQVNSHLFQICSRLLEFNINTQKIYEAVYYWELNEIRFRNKMINKAKMYDNLITVVLEPEEYSEFDLDYQTAKDLAMSLVEVKRAQYLVASVKNSETGKYHVSLRSKDLAIDDIARKYGGGGHKRASGVRVPNENVLNRIISDVKKKSKESENTAEH